MTWVIVGAVVAVIAFFVIFGLLNSQVMEEVRTTTDRKLTMNVPYAVDRPIVRRWVDLQLDPQQAQDFWDRAGLAWKSASGDTTSTEVPTITEVGSGQRGPYVDCIIVRGQSLADWEKALPRIAPMIGSKQLTVTEPAPGRMRLVTVLRDPLGTLNVAALSSTPQLIDSRTSIPIGRRVSGESFALNLRTDVVHLLMQGVSRFGKSSLMYLMLSWMARMRDVQVWGFDHTSMVLGPLEGLPGKRATTDDVVDHMRLMDDLLDLLKQRISQLVAMELDSFEDIADPTTMPIVVVVCEEFPGLVQKFVDHDRITGVKAADRLAPRLEAGIGRLTAEGGKVGIKVVLLSQRFLIGTGLTSTTRSNCNVRMTFLTDAAGVELVLPDADPATIERVTKFGKGRAMITMDRVPSFELQADYLGGYSKYIEQVKLAKALRGVEVSDV